MNPLRRTQGKLPFAYCLLPPQYTRGGLPGLISSQRKGPSLAIPAPFTENRLPWTGSRVYQDTAYLMSTVKLNQPGSVFAPMLPTRLGAGDIPNDRFTLIQHDGVPATIAFACVDVLQGSSMRAIRDALRPQMLSLESDLRPDSYRIIGQTPFMVINDFSTMSSSVMWKILLGFTKINGVW
jgi:hypothetical protein